MRTFSTSISLARCLSRQQQKRIGAVIGVGFVSYGLYTYSDNDKNATIGTRIFDRDFAVCSPVAVGVFAWGSNQFGQLGIGSDKDQALPRQLSFFKDNDLVPVSLSAFGNMTAVVSSVGHCFTFGFDAEANQSIPTPLVYKDGDIPKIIQVDVGGMHGAALTAEGDVLTWGNGWQGQLGNGEESSSQFPVKVAADGVNFVQVSCGHKHTAAIDTNGRLWTWGCGRDAALGLGDRSSTSRPIIVEGLTDVIQVSCGHESTLCLTKNGQVFSWGSNDYGQLGHGATVNRYEFKPKMIRSLKNETVSQIASGDYHCSCVTKDGKVYTWGMGKDGQTGHADKVDIDQPKLVNRLKDKKIRQVACGGGHTCAISDEGQLFVWGRGRSGQIGRADNIESVAAYRSTPQHVDTFSKMKVLRVDCGGDHTVALAEG